MTLDDAWLTWIWLIAGLLLMGAEFFVPGFVVVFLGFSAVVVSMLRFLGLVDGLTASFLIWIALSVVSVLVLRSGLRKWFPPEEHRGDTDEDMAAFGALVEVVEACPEQGEAAPGRIRFQGSTWPAWSTQGTIPEGAQAKLVYRQDLSWVIEPVEPLQLEAGSVLAGRVPARAPQPGGHNE